MLVYVELLIYLLILFGIIFPIFYCFYILVRPRLTPYCLKGKKGIRRLDSSYRFKNYVHRSNNLHDCFFISHRLAC
jgi:hypothetical protein